MIADLSFVYPINSNRLVEIVRKADLVIFAAGFEDRAFFIPTLKGISIRDNAHVYGINFINGPERNSTGFTHISRITERVHWINYNLKAPHTFEFLVREHFEIHKTEPIEHVVLDISAMPQYVMMELLAALRNYCPMAIFTCVYIAADNYYPDEGLIEKWLEKHSTNLGVNNQVLERDLIVPSLDPLCPNTFAGTAQRRDVSAMFLMAGYEQHRSQAAYEGVNPHRLILFHSRPAIKGAELRLEFSKKIHLRIGTQASKAIEILDNLDIESHLNKFKEYYDYLFDDHDIVLVPVHSKMQAIACYLFWEAYPDVQVIFPIPLDYNVNQGGQGVGVFYEINLPSSPLNTTNVFPDAQNK